MTTWIVTFERIGRVHNPAPIEVEAEPDDALADRLAAAIHRKASRFLSSSWYEVTVRLDPDEESGTFSIEAGRFGRGTIVRKAA